MDYIRITDDNIEKEHICCAMSGKQGVIKKEWLKQRFKEGLVFCRSTEVYGNAELALQTQLLPV